MAVVNVREFTSEGHRLLCESSYSPAEIARLSGQTKPRISEWRGGQKRPVHEARVALERAVGIPVRTWDQPPMVRTPRSEHSQAPAQTVAQPGTKDPPALDLALDATLATLGLDGLERLARQLEALAPQLAPRERVGCIERQSRVLVAHEALRQKSASARAEYLASAEFQDDARLVASALGASSGELRRVLVRFGIALPEPTSTTESDAIDAPTTIADVEELVAELEVADGFRKRGEVALAAGHVLGLGIDVHAHAIARLIADDARLTTRLLGLLEGADEKIVRAALERRLAVRDAAALPPEIRKTVAELLRHLGHDDVARDVDGG